MTQVWAIMILFYFIFFTKSTGFNYMHAFVCLKDVIKTWLNERLNIANHCILKDFLKQW